MPDLQTRLTEAAVRPLANDAEVMQSGRGFLSTLTIIPARAAEDALKRWDAVDAKVGKTAWRLFFYLVVTAVLVVSLNSDLSEFQRYQRINRNGPSGYFLQDRFGRTYSAAEKRFLLIGSANKPISERARVLWDSDPNNAAYFANYAVSCLSDAKELPVGFIETARRLDPENSFFPYLAASNEFERVDKINTKLHATRGGTAANEPYDYAQSIFHEAGKLPRFDNYLIQLRRERISFLPQSTIFEYMDSVNFLDRSYCPNRYLGNMKYVIQSRLSSVSASGDEPGFIELNRDTDAFLRGMTHSQSDSFDNYMFAGNELSNILDHLAMGAKKLGLNSEVAELRSKAHRLKQWDIDCQACNYQIDGKEWRAKAGMLKWRFVPIKQAVHPPALTDNDVKPGRMFDHGVLAQICSYAVAAALGLAAIAVALFRFRSPPLVRRLSVRMEVLLRPVDWLWLLAAGIPPLPYLMLIAHLTNLGGYGSSFAEMPIDLPYGGHANLPMAQFAGVLLMMLILPILVARLRLGIRAAAFGFANSRLWLGELALLSAAAFIPVVGWAVIAESNAGLVAAWILLGLPVAWLCGVACRAMICGTAWLLHHTTASRVLVPAYVGGLFFLLMTMPFFKWSRQYWFERDRLSHLDPAYPGFSKFEYELSLAARKELREALGYDP